MSYIGQPLARREDVRFLTGSGNFVDDVKLANTAWIAFLRSPHAHARIRGIDSAGATSTPNDCDQELATMGAIDRATKPRR